jgi:DNA-directed RNA polymerase sigma subunit (sigma70/sigma32)
MSEEKAEKKLGRPKRRTPLDKLSRERVRQIQETALGKMRRRLYAMGLTSTKDFLE